jgi:hypothetical protein
MSTLQVNDRVQFVPVPAYELHPDYVATGIVARLHNWGGIEYALVQRDDGLLPKLIDVRDLKLLTYRDMVQALAARPLDDQTREDAIAASTVRDIVDDYEEAMLLAQAGNLGIIEL